MKTYLATYVHGPAPAADTDVDPATVCQSHRVSAEDISQAAAMAARSCPEGHSVVVLDLPAMDFRSMDSAELYRTVKRLLDLCPNIPEYQRIRQDIAEIEAATGFTDAVFTRPRSEATPTEVGAVVLIFAVLQDFMDQRTFP